MFDLAFFKIVNRVMRLKEAPETRFMNVHETYTHRGSSVEDGKDALRLYVCIAYPSYFGVGLRVGCVPRFRDLVVVS